ncbi:ML domain-containing protein [Roridomyces roridus]|uniref:Phosphatidylglycerol/phosphatidylinositol transfer protein n=1 Tax=Roridomyces roridus TaxID=1738132 RepID=A0AAD7C067_9AGAR|nr:ML domain-containing protein [Roridomyces roridus]
MYHRVTAASLLLLSSLAVALPGKGQFALAPASGLLAPDSWGYTDCGAASDVVQINSISVSPDPPKIGAQLTVTIDAEVKETIKDGATADVLVKVGRIKLLQKTFDLCEEARNANATISCPVEPGVYQIVQSVDLPKEVPKLKYSISVDAFTVDKDPMACVDLTVQFSPFNKLQLWE